MSRSRHLVAPELLPIVDAFPPLIFSGETLPAIRAGQIEMFAERPSKDMPGVEVDELFVPVAGGPDVRVLRYRPAGAGAPLPAILHIHGGGHVVGLPELNDVRNAGWTERLGCVVVSVDYRLSPEAPYPAALDDCHAVLVWLHERAADFGIDATRITIAGESAGGNLAAGLCLRARDAGEHPVRAQLLVYPMLDDRHDRPRNPYCGEFVWTPDLNIFGWTSLLGSRTDVPAEAAPARADDLAGLPPTLIGVGTLDLFVDEDIDYARRLIAAGVPTDLLVVAGAFHGFDAMSQGPMATEFSQSIERWLKRQL
jgi:acetyl esterase/lipase